jgi:hypothetical protein
MLKIPETHPGLERVVPDFDYLLIDLSAIPDNKLPGNAMSQLALRFMKAARRGNIEDTLAASNEMLSNAAETEEGFSFATTLFEYILTLDLPIDKQRFKDIIRELKNVQIKEFGMTIAEQFKEEGIDKGILIGQIQFMQSRLGDAPKAKEALGEMTLVELDAMRMDLEQRFEAAF